MDSLSVWIQGVGTPIDIVEWRLSHGIVLDDIEEDIVGQLNTARDEIAALTEKIHYFERVLPDLWDRSGAATFGDTTDGLRGRSRLK